MLWAPRYTLWGVANIKRNCLCLLGHRVWQSSWVQLSTCSLSHRLPRGSSVALKVFVFYFPKGNRGKLRRIWRRKMMQGPYWINRKWGSKPPWGKRWLTSSIAFEHLWWVNSKLNDMICRNRFVKSDLFVICDLRVLTWNQIPVLISEYY